MATEQERAQEAYVRVIDDVARNRAHSGTERMIAAAILCELQGQKLPARVHRLTSWMAGQRE